MRTRSTYRDMKYIRALQSKRNTMKERQIKTLQKIINKFGNGKFMLPREYWRSCERGLYYIGYEVMGEYNFIYPIYRYFEGAAEGDVNKFSEPFVWLHGPEWIENIHYSLRIQQMHDSLKFCEEQDKERKIVEERAAYERAALSKRAFWRRFDIESCRCGTKLVKADLKELAEDLRRRLEDVEELITRESE